MSWMSGELIYIYKEDVRKCKWFRFSMRHVLDAAGVYTICIYAKKILLHRVIGSGFLWNVSLVWWCTILYINKLYVLFSGDFETYVYVLCIHHEPHDLLITYDL